MATKPGAKGAVSRDGAPTLWTTSLIAEATQVALPPRQSGDRDGGESG